MSLTPQERETLELVVEKLEQKIIEDSLTAEGLEQSRQEAKKEDDIYSKEWNKYHSWILGYEKEIEGLSGSYIEAPFSIKDLEEHVENRGRLYQGLVSTDPKIISEMVGSGLASETKKPNETEALSAEFDELIDILVNGINALGTSVVGDGGYSPGDSTISCSTALNANSWYLCNNDVLLKIGDVTSTPAGGSCDLPEYTDETACTDNGGTWTATDPSWVGNIEQVYGDNSIPSGSTMGDWAGYSNTERTNKTATSTTQRLMNALISHLNDYIDAWLNALLKTKIAVENNEAPNMSISDQTTTIDDYNDLNTYRYTTPILDGSPGIDELKLLISSRKSFISTRPVTISNAKKEYYGQRINYTKMRSNIQGGSLTKMRYFEKFQSEFPVGGSPEERKRLLEIKTLLAED